jgi:hypothetical protein
MGFGVTPIHPAELLKLLEKQLQQSGQCTGPDPNPPGLGLGDRAFLSLWTDDMHAKAPRAKQFVAIRPARFPIWQSIVQGSGTPALGWTPSTGIHPKINTTLGFNAVVSLSCFVQINSDPEMKSNNMVSEDVLSVTDFVLKVAAAVQLWAPADASGNILLREPGRILDGGFGFRPVSGKDGWYVSVAFDLELKHTAKFFR